MDVQSHRGQGCVMWPCFLGGDGEGAWAPEEKGGDRLRSAKGPACKMRSRPGHSRAGQSCLAREGPSTGALSPRPPHRPAVPQQGCSHVGCNHGSHCTAVQLAGNQVSFFTT